MTVVLGKVVKIVVLGIVVMNVVLGKVDKIVVFGIVVIIVVCISGISGKIISRTFKYSSSLNSGRPIHFLIELTISLLL